VVDYAFGSIAPRAVTVIGVTVTAKPCKRTGE